MTTWPATEGGHLDLVALEDLRAVGGAVDHDPYWWADRRQEDVPSLGSVRHCPAPSRLGGQTLDQFEDSRLGRNFCFLSHHAE